MRHYIDQPKEKAAIRLAVTYGILRRLNFSEDWAERCLRAICGIDLDEALDWVGSNNTEIAFSAHVPIACYSLS